MFFFFCLLAWITMLPWRWRQYIPPKRSRDSSVGITKSYYGHDGRGNRNFVFFTMPSSPVLGSSQLPIPSVPGGGGCSPQKAHQLRPGVYGVSPRGQYSLHDNLTSNIITVYSKNDTKPVKTACWNEAEISDVEICGIELLCSKMLSNAYKLCVNWTSLQDTYAHGISF
jgi:hypothetical protein